jgi:hypothetical protein
MLSPLTLFVIYTTVFFIVTPLYLVFKNDEPYAIQLIIVTFVSNSFIVIGYITKKRLNFNFLKIRIDPTFFCHVSFIFFTFFAFYSFYTSGGIPLFNILLDHGNPDVLRGMLFKGREGTEIILLYLSAFFSYVLIPISVILAFHYKVKLRFYYLFWAVLFSISTLQKALVMNVLFPLFAYLFLKRKVGIRFYVITTFIIFIYFILMIKTTGHADNNTLLSNADFFSSSYVPSGAIDYFIWRFFSVPIYTAIDTLYVFNSVLHSEYLLGASSSLLSFLLGFEKIEIEKLVFEYQFGGYNALANANTYFAVGLFIDFSWIGVCVISFLVGSFYAAINQSKDLSIISMGYLFAWLSANGSLIGIMFSSGFLYLVLHIMFIRFNKKGSYVR